LLDRRAAEDERIETRTHRTIEVGASYDAPHERAARMGEAVYCRLNRQHQPSEAARPYVGYTFPDLARECLRNAGQRTIGLSPMALITRAYQTTSDFPLIAGDSVSRELRRIYQRAPRGVLQCARFLTNSDFRSRTLLSFEGSNIDLERVNEHGEYHYGSLAESGEAVKLETWGKIVSWTRQMAVNDDLGALERVSQLLAAAAVAKEDDVAAALLVTGTGSNGPTLSDGNQLFSAAHGNLAAGADIGAPSETTLDKARVAVRTQKGPNGKVIGIEPAILLVPPALETVAKKQIAVVQATETANVNAFTELKVVVDARLSGTAWYLVGAPELHDGLVAAHLEGEPGPQLETRVGFNIDGTEMRVRLDFGAAFVDWRSWYKNPG
jgi:hypothetical protein